MYVCGVPLGGNLGGGGSVRRDGKFFAAPTRVSPARDDAIFSLCIGVVASRAALIVASSCVDARPAALPASRPGGGGGRVEYSPIIYWFDIVHTWRRGDARHAM